MAHRKSSGPVAEVLMPRHASSMVRWLREQLIVPQSHICLVITIAIVSESDQLRCWNLKIAPFSKINYILVVLEIKNFIARVKHLVETQVIK